MGRRRDPFSKRSLAAFEKRSPKSKIGSGIFGIIAGTAVVIVGIVLATGDYSIIAAPAFFTGFFFLIVGIIILFIGCTQKKEQDEFEKNAIHANMNEIDVMDGKTFERFLAAIFKKQGYKVTLTKASGDYGVDLILNNDVEKIIVQAKRYRNKVSLSAVQQISAARDFYGTTTAWVITNNYFTKPAVTLARSNNIKLIDRKALAALISSVKDEELSITETPQPDTTCPKQELTITIKTPKPSVQTSSSITNNKKSSIEEEIQYDNWLSSKLIDLKNEIIALYSTFSFEKIKEKIRIAESYTLKTTKNKISLHYFYQDILGIVYALRYNYDDAINDCLALCDKDIALLPELGLSNITVFSLSRKAIIYEKNNELQKAIEVCDFGIKYSFLDNGKPFLLRKTRLLKKLEKINHND